VYEYTAELRTDILTRGDWVVWVNDTPLLEVKSLPTVIRPLPLGNGDPL